MQIRCEKCGTVYDLDPSVLPRGGAPVQCTRCSHVFHAVPPEPTGPGIAPPKPLPREAAGMGGGPAPAPETGGVEKTLQFGAVQVPKAGGEASPSPMETLQFASVKPPAPAATDPASITHFFAGGEAAPLPRGSNQHPGAPTGPGGINRAVSPLGASGTVGQGGPNQMVPNEGARQEGASRQDGAPRQDGTPRQEAAPRPDVVAAPAKARAGSRPGADAPTTNAGAVGSTQEKATLHLRTVGPDATEGSDVTRAAEGWSRLVWGALVVLALLSLLGWLWFGV